MLTDIEKVIREYLPTMIHMSLATSRDNQPWVCEVHFAYDDELNLYFRSLKDTRHSLEIEDNNKVAGNIVTEHHMNDKPRGVYFEGTCELLNDVDENHIAFKAYSERFQTGNAILTDIRGFYKITVNKFFVFDARESSPSQKYELEWSNRIKD